ncbi:hypothetical protein B0H19DRAFT_224113 [Mycena capillaripes]|nr:hypothetical protein B0H19DRAFT_224113 [Mycena capillaripes]
MWGSNPEDLAPHKHDPVNGFSFNPTVPTSEHWGGWHCILGFESTVDIILRSNDLPRQPANPPVALELDEEPASLPTGSRTGQAENDDEEDSADDEEDSDDDEEDSDDDEEDSSDGEFEGAEVDLAKLERLLDHWETKTRPFNLRIAARHSLFSAVRRHRTGTASPNESQRLFRQFKRRAAADTLAQKLAEEAGIALQLHCEDFRELDELPGYCEIPFMLVKWGALSPHDLVDRMRQPYKKAGQWLFRCWSESGEGKLVLEDVLNKVGGKIYKFTSNGIVPIDL